MESGIDRCRSENGNEFAMSIQDFFISKVPTVKDLLVGQGYMQESEILQSSNITCYEDNQDFGNSYYEIIIEVQTDKYIALNKHNPVVKIEEILLEAFKEATKGALPPDKIIIRPNSNIQETLFESGEYKGWRNGYFRVFISHITKKKEQASCLKAVLEEYGITSFVAHEDIEPTSEWEKEIQRALNSMDCMVPMLYDGFHQSHWCDQEVGVAIGRNITVIPLLVDGDSYGLLGAYQGIKIKGMYPNTLAKKIFEILCNNANTRPKYLSSIINLLLSSSNQGIAEKWLNMIEKISNTDALFWQNIQSHVNDNAILLESAILDRLNDHFTQHAIPRIERKTEMTLETNDLPF